MVRPELDALEEGPDGDPDAVRFPGGRFHAGAQRLPAAAPRDARDKPAG
jgi:hypothetical protein